MCTCYSTYYYWLKLDIYIYIYVYIIYIYVYILKFYIKMGIRPLHIPRSTQCSTTGVTKAVVYIILSVG